VRYALPLLLAPLALGACQSVPDSASASFRGALERHVAAIQSRDYQSIVDTVTTGDRLILIFPNGERYDAREQFLAFHREWFADPAWVMVLEPVRVREGRDCGYALYRTSYDPDGAGPTPGRPAYLSLWLPARGWPMAARA
jgi:ketosteroid isomerase-like protein